MEIIIDRPESVKLLKESLNILAIRQRFLGEVRYYPYILNKPNVVEIVEPTLTLVSGNAPKIITQNELSKEN